MPIPTKKPPVKQKEISEDSLLKVLAEDYRVNPGLHMSREDLLEYYEIEDEKLDRTLLDLEGKNFVKLFRDKKGIALAKATYDGLKAAYPLDHYKWFPSWIKDDRIF